MCPKNADRLVIPAKVVARRSFRPNCPTRAPANIWISAHAGGGIVSRWGQAMSLDGQSPHVMIKTLEYEKNRGRKFSNSRPQCFGRLPRKLGAALGKLTVRRRRSPLDQTSPRSVNGSRIGAATRYRRCASSRPLTKGHSRCHGELGPGRRLRLATPVSVLSRTDSC